MTTMIVTKLLGFVFVLAAWSLLRKPGEPGTLVPNAVIGTNRNSRRRRRSHRDTDASATA